MLEGIFKGVDFSGGPKISGDWGSQQGLEMIILHDSYVLLSFSVMALILGSLAMFTCKKGMMVTNVLNRCGKKSNNGLEFFWTVAAMGLLSVVTYLSLAVLYSSKFYASSPSSVTVKVIGHQWYWEYEYVFNLEQISGQVGDANFAPSSFVEVKLSGLCGGEALSSFNAPSVVIIGQLFMWPSSGAPSGGGPGNSESSSSDSSSGSPNGNDGNTGENPSGWFVPESSGSQVDASRAQNNPGGWFVPEPSGNQAQQPSQPTASSEMEGLVNSSSEPDPGMDINNNDYGVGDNNR
nr:COX2 [Donax trunculus]